MSIFDYRHLEEDYEKALKLYGPGPKALLWWDYRSMAIRFRALIKHVPVQGKSIMDAGCGLGDLLPYLYSKAADFKYLGVDTNKEFIELAKKHYEGHRFEVGDPFNKQVGNFDVIISSGVMNGNVPNWFDKRKKMIANLFSQTDEVLAFNMAGGLKPIPPDPLIAYADPQKIYDYCKTMTKHVKLDTSYLERDFTIVMSKTNPLD